MKVVLLLIALFVLACMFYGIYASISTLWRIRARIGGNQNHGAVPPEPAICCLPSVPVKPSGPNRDYVKELQALFTLYRSGALMAEEFEEVKQPLFTEMK